MTKQMTLTPEQVKALLAEGRANRDAVMDRNRYIERAERAEALERLVKAKDQEIATLRGALYAQTARADRFERDYTNLMGVQDDEAKRWYRHTMMMGDRLTRYVRELNGIINHQAMAGIHLVVPVKRKEVAGTVIASTPTMIEAVPAHLRMRELMTLITVEHDRVLVKRQWPREEDEYEI